MDSMNQLLPSGALAHSIDFSLLHVACLRERSTVEHMIGYPHGIRKENR